MEELTSLNQNWNLRLNKKKSEILTKEDLPEIGGVKCVKVVKYLWRTSGGGQEGTEQSHKGTN